MSFATTLVHADAIKRAGAVKTATIDLLLEREDIGRVFIDDNRGYAYFEVVAAAAKSSGPLPYANVYNIKNALKKIYAVPLDGRTAAKPLFDQDPEAGYFFANGAPWSPNNRYLAVYKMKDRNIQPGVFDSRRSKVRFYDLEVAYDPFFSVFSWISDTEFSVFTDNVGGNIAAYQLNGARAVAAARESAWRERQVSAQVFGSGRFARPATPDKAVLAKVSFKNAAIENAEVERLGVVAYNLGFAPKAPSEKAMVLARVPPVHSHFFEPLTSLKLEASLINLATGKKQLISPSATVRNYNTIAWSRSGKYFLFLQSADKAKKDVKTHQKGLEGGISVIDAATTAVVAQLPKGASNPVWVGDRLVYSQKEEQGLLERVSADNAAAANKIALRINTPPPVAATGDGVYYYLENGDLWRAQIEGARVNLTRDYPYAIRIYKFPDRRGLSSVSSGGGRNTPSLDEIVFTADIDGRSHVVSFAAGGRLLDAIPFPDEGSQLLANASDGAVFLTNVHGVGSELEYVRRQAGAEPRVLYRFNQHLADVATAVGPIRIEHKSYDGRDITGWLYLPPGASLERPERRPLVVIGYGGTVYKDTPPINRSYAASIWDLSLSNNTIMEVFAAQGYAVLLPSIPLGKAPGDPMAQIMPAVLSGVDAAIGTGHVDPDRLAFSSQSYGGYTALSIAAQTDRFQAIIAMASVSNLISRYGQFDPNARPDAANFNLPGNIKTSWFEHKYGQGRMGAPPWADIERYVRNSPMLYADQVATPVMLIHGDVDPAVQISQAEEMFSALLRESKDALFVTYFGEEHVVHQPQNQRDMWRRIFTFLRDASVEP